MTHQTLDQLIHQAQAALSDDWEIHIVITPHDARVAVVPPAGEPVECSEEGKTVEEALRDAIDYAGKKGGE